MIPEEVRDYAEKAIKFVAKDNASDEKKEATLDFLQSVIECANKAMLLDTFIGYEDEENE